MSESLMELVQLNFRVPRYLKIAIENAAKLRGLTQDAYLDEALNAQLSQDAPLLQEACRLTVGYLGDLARQSKFKPSGTEGQR
jgi:hypothetical protein